MIQSCTKILVICFIGHLFIISGVHTSDPHEIKFPTNNRILQSFMFSNSKSQSEEYDKYECHIEKKLKDMPDEKPPACDYGYSTMKDESLKQICDEFDRKLMCKGIKKKDCEAGEIRNEKGRCSKCENGQVLKDGKCVNPCSDSQELVDSNCQDKCKDGETRNKDTKKCGNKCAEGTV